MQMPGNSHFSRRHRESHQTHSKLLNQPQFRPLHRYPQLLYFFIDDARRFRSSTRLLFSSVTRLARIWAYSFWTKNIVSDSKVQLRWESWNTYSRILLSLGLATLECDSVTLVLETLRSNETLDLGSFGIWLLALALWLDFTTDNEFADLYPILYQQR